MKFDKKENIFLFSVDLEDVRLRVNDGLRYNPSVEKLTEEYLDFLNLYKAKATFFTVGDIPKHYPDLIKTITAEGHEIACHSNKHIPVTRQSEEEFRDDLQRNMDNLYNAGAKELIGYRAPTYSITKDTEWAFGVLTDLGFKYSSSVLPAKNPLYGWKEFGEDPRKMNTDLWEIPVSLREGRFFKVPFSGGVYFRFLPFYFIKKSFNFHYNKNRAITSYFHPYDIDTEQEKFMHPEINDNWIYNKLMYFNRKGVCPRLHKIMDIFNPSIITYKSYIELLNEGK
ncbi:polysaccharide deacetylase family protein (PEP-CTERM system associated) [Aquimarina sp. EL_43]|uniref:polysaccharide deacetylase family protein n=1 Tax=unclassified Aquimarina TaxID=2627091 RepID=UPI0018CA4760|nr:MULTISPECIES: polysaccharide deacetylase family protein [unclassified Aquimarina]MBG6128549.1 polysaccharide deacetylase family protein (PEP-CTERM system associated) [Aquimarina sp. EL_35]MBG6149612.1 polysaccharide deacetylase family protein (PEP-CTERM system associated) [Aquimarina sp. EL_32]MBG6167703.1 polysaccharide deacetylase family protein (PEP-CTERM system associated) [Aquimarina sp. EL_43]